MQSKAIVLYILAALGLFGSLFATFAIAGIGLTGPFQVGDESGTAAVPTSPESRKSDTSQTSLLAPKLDYPDLEVGRTYQVSHATQVLPEPDARPSQARTIPASGFFAVENTFTINDDLWYRIGVSDGHHDYSMYLAATELNWKRVVPEYTEADRKAESTAQMEALLAQLRARGEARRAQRAALVEPEPETLSAKTWWATVVKRVGGSSQANLLVSAVAALALTVVTLVAIGAIAWMRRMHTWDIPDVIEDETNPASAQDDEYYDEDIGVELDPDLRL